MTTFSIWILSELEKRGIVEDLVKFSVEQKDNWPRAGNIELYEKAIRDNVVDEKRRDRLLSSLYVVWNDWHGEQNAEKGKVSKIFDTIYSNIAGTAATLLVVLMIGVLFHAFLSPTGILTRVRDFEIARGSITFIFSFGTIVIALILLCFSLFSSTSEKEYEKRFSQGKEVLTILIGILGTIVGFYFGSSIQANVATPIDLSKPQIINSAPTPGESFTIIFHAKGGSPPYKYSIKFDKDLGAINIENKNSDTGLVIEEFKLPKETNKYGDVNTTITVMDTRKQIAETKIIISIKKPIPQEQPQ